MKKVKRIVSLMVATILIIATIAPAMASTYDVASPGPGFTSWEVFRVYHWVVRGDTLANIAARWGTTPALIESFNEQYFHDLRLRSTTYGVNIKLEPGVKLHIYDVLRARHYVRRGDTLQTLTNPGLGAPSAIGWFPMTTTIPAFRNENTARPATGHCPSLSYRGWFNDLYTINRTVFNEVGRMPLVESDVIGAVYDVIYVDPFGTRPAPYRWYNVTSLPHWPTRLISDDPLGTPVYVTIPVRAHYAISGIQALPVSDVVYYRSIVEVLPWVGGTTPPHLQFDNTFNPPPTNPALPDRFVGVERRGVRGHSHFTFERLDIPFFYGN